jgi:tetratricopeptide (TPR) repeat protein
VGDVVPNESEDAQPVAAGETTDSGSSRRRARFLGPLLVLLLALVAFTATFWEPLTVHRRQTYARESLRAHRDDDALAELRAALRRDLDNHETLLLLARVHRRLGDLDKVALLLNHAEALGADAERTELERRLVLAQTGRMREVEPYLTDMLVSGSGDDGPEVCQAYVQGYFANLRTNDALRLLDGWEESYPEDPQPVFMRAYLWQSMGQPARAIGLYRKALAVAPERTKMRRRLAEALLENGDVNAAEAELSMCVERTPGDAEVRYLLARCAFNRSDFERALERLTKVLELAPDHLDARILKGQLHLARNQPEEALRELEPVVAQRLWDTEAREALGRALRSVGRTEEAKAHLDFVAQAATSLPQLDRLTRESLTKPADAELRYEIATILSQYGPPDDAARWMRAVLNLQPDHEGAHRALAAYFEQRGDAANATFHRLRAEADRQQP